MPRCKVSHFYVTVEAYSQACSPACMRLHTAHPRTHLRLQQHKKNPHTCTRAARARLCAHLPFFFSSLRW